MLLTIAGQAGSHRFEERHRKPLEASRQHEHILLGIKIEQRRVGQRSCPTDAGIERPAPSELRFVGPRSGNRPGDGYAGGLKGAVDLGEIEDTFLRLLDSSGVDEPQRTLHRSSRDCGNHNAVRQVEDCFRPVRQAYEELVVHPPRIGDERVHDRVVPHGKVVVVLHIAVQHVDDGLTKVVRRCDGEVEQVARHINATAARNRARDATHDSVQVLHRQRVLDRRLRIGGERLAKPQVVMQTIVRQDGMVAERVRLPVREQVRDDVRTAAHLVGQHVHDARAIGHGRQARTVMAHCMALPGNGVSAPATGSRQISGTTSSIE